ncbi:MAG: hypothetical protein ACRDRN_04520 [Sciscionella sp.]
MTNTEATTCANASSDRADECVASTGECALDGCDNPLPSPPVAPDGRRKGGRPPAYCCKAHADAASRARRGAQTSAITDPLAEVRRIVESFDPAARSLLQALAEIQHHFTQAEAGALGRVTAADAEATAARDEAGDAERAAHRADAARANALAAARDERQARQAAERTAERAERRAEEIRKQGWEQVAEHERGRGAAETAQLIAQAARDELAAELRVARADYGELRDVHRALQRQLADRDADLARAGAEHTTITGELDTCRERMAEMERDRDAAREELRDVRMELRSVRQEQRSVRDAMEQARGQLGTEHIARRLAEARATASEQNLAAVRGEVAAANDRFDRLLADRDRDRAPDNADEDPATGDYQDNGSGSSS